ncbi:MAG: biopolymer transporter ExbD [Oligoflexia bacterium]|nr:biopolymer transporter ExbD [Oligoflexia bacterium]
MGFSAGQADDDLNVELNLVPFIDLLSSLVLFLLVTAVWLQVGTIPASVESKGQSRVSVSEQNRLTINLTNSGIKLSWPESFKQRSQVPSNISADFTKLSNVLGSAIKLSSAITSVTVGVASEDSVEYGKVVKAIDVAKKAGFNIVALSTE